LAETGELSSTYIVVTSDNGYLLGEHRIRTGKRLGYEPSARVPLLMRGPGIPSGAVVEQLVGLHDLAPTVLQATGTYGAQTHPLDGRSLLPLIGDDDVAAKRDLVLEAGQYRGVRTHTGWKYIEYGTGEKEMYNLDTDPLELQNLVRRPALDAKQAALAQRLDELKHCVGRKCRSAG
jgi:arylsulfatase A-like enzyme